MCRKARFNFRAKVTDDVDKDGWYKGGISILSNTTYCFEFEEDYERAAQRGKDPRRHYIFFEKMTDLGLGLPKRHYRVPVRTETLCMCTEYVKDNKYVYEGDIIKEEFGSIGLIKFGKYSNVNDSPKTEHYGFYIEWKDGELLRKDIGYWMNLDTTKVIGNIIDNPELLARRVGDD